MISSPFLFVVLALALPTAFSFQASTLSSQQTAVLLKMNPDKSAFSFGSDPTKDDVVSASSRHPHCDLPGDPSLILTTNVDLGRDKPEILKKLSALVASSLGKPESYVGESICSWYDTLETIVRKIPELYALFFSWQQFPLQTKYQCVSGEA